MVRIAIAGATGDVAKEVVDVLCAAKKHDILLLSRKGAPKDEPRPVRWAQTDYTNGSSLATMLEGVHTVFSFVDPMSDTDNVVQRTLIDACVKARVKRFAPSEWAVSNVDDLPWYAGKRALRKYLADLNKDEKVLEYCLFCPGIFSNYYTYPHPSAKHLNIFELNVDFHKRRALLLEGKDFDSSRISLTTVQDLAEVVSLAVDYEGEWPIMGGINGCELSVDELVDIGEKIRGKFSVERLDAEDLRDGVVKSSWLPTVGHHSSSPEMWQGFVPKLISALLLATAAGSMSVSDEWNQRLPDYAFTTVEEFLMEVWMGKD